MAGRSPRLETKPLHAYGVHQVVSLNHSHLKSVVVVVVVLDAVVVVVIVVLVVVVFHVLSLFQALPVSS